MTGGLAQAYGFTDIDGSRPDAWRDLIEVQEAGKRPMPAVIGNGNRYSALRKVRLIRIGPIFG